MSFAKQHQEWLQLLEISGPFLAMPVIVKTFPQGLERIDAGTKRELRLAYQEWLDSHSDYADSRMYHTPWIKHVLKNVLEYPSELILEGDSVPMELTIHLREHGEYLKPDMVIMPPYPAAERSGPRILISVFPAKQKLDRAVVEIASNWNASPATRMMELLRRSGVRVGIVTNGEHWLLVYSPQSDTTSFVGWYSSVWMEEELTVRSFRGLLSAYRFFGVPETEMLESLFAQSIEFQHEVTTQLGGQVRSAIEQLVQALDQIDKDSGRTFLRDVSEAKLYEAGVNLMMRLVFLLSAEERELFPINNQIYNYNYAVLTLREQLEQLASRHGEEVLERRYDAWNRLLATFRAIYGGVRHEDFNLPAYGGSLFDPDRYPFLEGRAPGTLWHETNVVPLPINNRTVLHLLDSLQLLRGTGAKSEARKLSFRALDVEQIGHVYESLLEHTAVRADDLILGLEGAQGKEPEVALSKLKYQSENGENELLQWLHDETGKSTNVLSKLIKKQDRYPDYKIRAVCDNEDALYYSVKPYVGLVREDSQSMPVIFTPGSVYVTEGAERRSTGTHYTPRSLTEPIVEHAIAPLVYEGMADGNVPSIGNLRSPKELLELKICDMTCGSGAFLVQACRYLSERLLEAWTQCRNKFPDGTEIDVYGEGLIFPTKPDKKNVVPRDPDDALVLARRLIADRCLYGVDCNPMAVEMAKLSLWLLTLQKERPFAFLDHAIKCGDSLIGVTHLKQLVHFSPGEHLYADRLIYADTAIDLVNKAKERRIKLEEMPEADICDTDVKLRLNAEACRDVRVAITIGDLLMGWCFLHAADSSSLKRSLDNAALLLAPCLRMKESEEFILESLTSMRGDLASKLTGTKLDLIERRPFHWPLEFPEVFMRGSVGFDAMIGNPPFVGGRRLQGTLGANYRDFLGGILCPGATTNADLVAFFFRRAMDLLSESGIAGLIASKSIEESATSDVSLRAILESGGEIFRASANIPWPGPAGVRVSVLHLRKRAPAPFRPIILNDEIVSAIDPTLREGESSEQKPFSLDAFKRTYSEGTKLYGKGFVLTPDQADVIIAADRKNSEVISPYLTGDSINSLPPASFPPEYVINFGTMSIEESQRYVQPFAQVTERVKPERDKLTGQIHESRYWLFWDKRESFYSRIRKKKRVLVTSVSTKYLCFSFFPTNYIFSHNVKLFDFEDYEYFAVLQSTLHDLWARRHSTNPFGSILAYRTSHAFDTFPWPERIATLRAIGEEYYQHRCLSMEARNQGLTAIYNDFHDLKVTDENVNKLRELQIKLDKEVMRCYGWDDLSLDYKHQETKGGPRFTFSVQQQRDILSRLLALNRLQYEVEKDDKAKKKSRD